MGRAARRWAGQVCATGVVLVAASVASAGEDHLSLHSWTDKRPRIAGRHVIWTGIIEPVGSWGRVQLTDLATGIIEDLGEGFDPDLTTDMAGQGRPLGPTGAPGNPSTTPSSGPTAAGVVLGNGPAPDPAPSLRAAWLRFGPSLQLDLVSWERTPVGDRTRLLATDLGWAGQVRVDGPVTVWSSQDGAVPSVFAHDGDGITRLSTGAPALRPEVVHDAAGLPVVVWDEYHGGPGSLDYEVFLCRGLPGGGWGPAQNISQTPTSADLDATVAADGQGGVWVAFATDRGTAKPWVQVQHVAADGAITFPAPYPSSLPQDLPGIVDLKVHRATYEPVIELDALGRVWLFTTEKPANGYGLTAYDKQIRATVYGGSAWSAPVLVSDQPRTEQALDVVPSGEGMRIVYQHNGPDPATGLQVVTQVLHTPTLAMPPVTAPATLPSPPALYLSLPELPRNRLLTIAHEPRELVFADLHSHSSRSPDAMGELDHALHYARDLAGIDVWAPVNHDSRDEEYFLDFEYELDRRLIALLEGPDFVALMGYEWTNNNQNFIEGEDVGHRATFDSPYVLRYTDPGSNDLQEFYDLMGQVGAIGVPHHLGKLGGATFLTYDPEVQPVTQIKSVHGTYEDEVWQKLTGYDARFAIIAGGDDHNATPGRSGLACVWVPAPWQGDKESFKQAMRDRHTFAVRNHGAHLDATLQGAAPGSELVHGGELRLQYTVTEVAFDEPLVVSLVRDGDWATPSYVRSFEQGEVLTDDVFLPGVGQPAVFMLRVSRHGGTSPLDTILWSSPFWVDPPAR